MKNTYQFEPSFRETNIKWNNILSGRQEPSGNERIFIEAVKRAKETGITFYAGAVKLVKKDLGDFIPENIDNGVYGGAIHAELIGAWKYIDFLNYNILKSEADKNLNLRLGQKIGRIIINTGKTIRGVIVESISDEDYGLIGALGNKRVRITLDSVCLKRAIQRANNN